jgi:Arc/MetJ-type ribon-helix-helix transcriptional regulator
MKIKTIIILLFMLLAIPAAVLGGTECVATESGTPERARERKSGERVSVSYRMPPNLHERAQILIYDRKKFASFSDLITQAVTRLIDEAMQQDTCAKLGNSNGSAIHTQGDPPEYPEEMSQELRRILGVEMQRVCEDLIRKAYDPDR